MDHFLKKKLSYLKKEGKPNRKEKNVQKKQGDAPHHPAN
ncbi:hypothetical protein DET65_4325 [Sunxiuqinia elliptica]|uniref:Uncharacterized protein n=1 Tax=Sunxiuqinia elliptica TaxID=655355 RepID=A0A4R6GQB1_9BACT|nr:hypothetical protein DET52_11125 [Sunxiuqinia elliptica]TDO55786.1 hypothetical protein DET65_4325 [Sunxiuqinia elliptica]